VQEQEVEPRRCWQRQEDMETSGFVMTSGPVDAVCRGRGRALEARGLLVQEWVSSAAALHFAARQFLFFNNPVPGSVTPPF
jgi:hypothetical protein